MGRRITHAFILLDRLKRAIHLVRAMCLKAVYIEPDASNPFDLSVNEADILANLFESLRKAFSAEISRIEAKMPFLPDVSRRRQLTPMSFVLNHHIT